VEIMANGTRTGDGARRAGERVGRMADEAEHTAREYFDQARHHVHQANEKIKHYINEHPTQSVLIAAGVGAFVGAVVTSMFRRN